MSYIASTYLTNYQLSYTTQHSSWLRIDFGGQRMIDLGGDTGCLHSMYLLDLSQCIEPIFFCLVCVLKVSVVKLTPMTRGHQCRLRDAGACSLFLLIIL